MHRLLPFLLSGLVLATTVPAQAAGMSLCNQTGAKLSGLVIEGGGKVTNGVLANDQCTDLSGAGPAAMTVNAMSGEDNHALLCRYTVAIDNATRILIDAKTPVSCIK
jgi:hypothetical protein